MKIELNHQEIKALSAAIAEEALKTLAPKLEALEKALLQRPLALPQPKPQASQGTNTIPLGKALLNRKELKILTGLGDTTLWRLGKAGNFPAKVQLSSGRVGWRHAEVMVWIESRNSSGIC